MPVLTLANFVVGSNTVLAIDTTVDASYTFAGSDSTYHLDVASGAITFTSPDGTVSLPGTVLLRGATHYYKYTVAGDMWTAVKTGTNAPAITVSLSNSGGDLEVTWSVDPDAISAGTYRLGFGETTATDMEVTSSPTTIVAADLPPSFDNYTNVYVGLYGSKGLLSSGYSSLVPPTTTTTTTAAPLTRLKAVFDSTSEVLWVLTTTSLYTYFPDSLHTVVTFSNLTPTSFALDTVNQALYLGTTSGVYSGQYTTGNYPAVILETELTQVNTDVVRDIVFVTDTLYYTTASEVWSYPCYSIGTPINVSLPNSEVPKAITFAAAHVYVSSEEGFLYKMDPSLNLHIIDTKNFIPEATQIAINDGSIVYAATGTQLWANDYEYMSQIPGSFGYHAPVITDNNAVAVSCNMYANAQRNYVVTANGNIFSIQPVLGDQEVNNINLSPLYPLPPPPPPTTAPPTTAPPTTAQPLTSTSTVTDVLAALGSQSASSVLAAAVSAGVSNATIMLAFAERAATSGTDVFSAYAGSSLAGASATILAANAAALYTKLGISGADATRDIFISVPSAGVLTLGPTSINTSLAIDDTVNATYTFTGYPNHTLSIASGVQTFTSPSGSRVLSQGVTFTLTNASGSVTYPVLHLDLTLANGTTSSNPICFLGDAPVKTPSGYRRIDSLKVGDRVSTPTGTAVIQNIHCQDYAAGPSANPYVIPKGRFGATQELLISPRHKVSVKGRMVEARDLGLQQRDVGPLTYYNLGLKGANMIVAGVTVESLASLTRIIISRAEFNRIVAAQHGGRITPEIAAACRFLQDGTVSVPALR
jgi:hypothetical protein